MIPGLGRCPGGGHGNPLQCSCLENPLDGRAWWAIVHGITKSQTQLSNLAHKTKKRWFSQNSHVFSIATLSNNSFVCMFTFYKKESAMLLLLLLLSRFSRVQLCTTAWSAAYQAPLPMGFSRQEYWSGLPLHSLRKCNT